MSHKIKSGSIIVNPTDLQQGSVQDQLEDRSAYLRSDDVVTWTGTQLEFTTDIILEIVHSSGGTITEHKVLLAGSPIVLADGESAWVSIDRTLATENLTVNLSGTTPIPAHSNADRDVVVLFRRIDTPDPVARLHIPLHKQVLEPGQTVVLGASGAGGGGGASLAEDIKRRLVLSPYCWATPNIYEVNEDDLVDVSSTGAFSPADNAFKFTGIGETMLSTQMLDISFLEPKDENDVPLPTGYDATKVHLYAKWVLDNIDTAATYEVSRDGGNEFQAITMKRLGQTNAYTGELSFADEAANQTLDEYAVGNADGTRALTDTGAQQKISEEYTPATSRVIKEFEVYLNKIEAVAGNVKGKAKIQVVKDDAGSPSTSPADIFSESDLIDLEALATGDTATLISMPSLPEVKDIKYHWVISTDAEYKASYVAATDEVSVRMDTSAPSIADAQEFDGTVWAAIAGEAATFKFTGRELDLRLRVTGGTTDALLSGYGLYYGIIPGLTASGGKAVQKFFFSGDENRTEFVLNEFTSTVDPELLTAYDVYRGQSYVIEEGVARLDGQTITFDPDFFNFPGEDVLLVFRQNNGSSFDSSDANANAISTINSNLIDLGEQVESCCASMILPKIAAPSTTVQNRALIPDLSQDLKPRFGIDRIMTQNLYQIQDEFGPNNESVFGVTNDKFSQIRCVGDCIDVNNANGVNIGCFDVDGNTFVEVTFYGTGLNLITIQNNSPRDFRVSIDGGAEGSNIYTTGTGIFNSRNYSHNQVINLASNETLGVHTVKIRVNGGSSQLELYGFEILNEEASGLIQLPPGSMHYKGRKLTHSTLETTPYNSDFESGALGAEGGHVLIYQKSDGSVAKAVTPTDASPAYLGSANHANEEIINKYNWREFGAGRRAANDDFTTLTTLTDRAFTLDDGTTTLVGDDVVQNGAWGDGFGPSTTSDFFTITFIGTGLDIIQIRSDATVGPGYDIYIDGILQSSGFVFNHNGKNIQKIVSGLPYGTHTVKIQRLAVGNGSVFSDFIVYGPKRPTLPAGAKEISSYFVMADFVANSTPTVEAISTGVLRKDSTREFTHEGTWGLTTVATKYMGGFTTSGTVIGSKLRYTFYGTGFELRFETNTDRRTSQVRLNGLDATVGGGNNFPTASSFNYGNHAGFTDATGILDQAGTLQDANGFGIKDLPLALYTLEFEVLVSAGSSLVCGAIDIITPIHSPKSNGPAVTQMTASVGSQGIKDLRQFTRGDVVKTMKWSQAVAIDSTTTAVSSTVYDKPIFDMHTTIETEGGPLEINFEESSYSNTSAAYRYFSIFVDGLQIGPERLSIYTNPTGGEFGTGSTTFIYPVSPGKHYIQIMTRQSHGSSYRRPTDGSLTVKELKDG